MSEIDTIKCDRCGTETPKDELPENYVFQAFLGADKIEDPRPIIKSLDTRETLEQKDLCTDCIALLRTALEDWAST